MSLIEHFTDDTFIRENEQIRLFELGEVIENIKFVCAKSRPIVQAQPGGRYKVVDENHRVAVLRFYQEVLQQEKVESPDAKTLPTPVFILPEDTPNENLRRIAMKMNEAN